MLDALAVVRELALKAVLEVMVGCFAANALVMFVPAIDTLATLMELLDVSVSCF